MRPLPSFFSLHPCYLCNPWSLFCPLSSVLCSLSSVPFAAAQVTGGRHCLLLTGIHATSLSFCLSSDAPCRSLLLGAVRPSRRGGGPTARPPAAPVVWPGGGPVKEKPMADTHAEFRDLLGRARRGDPDASTRLLERYGQIILKEVRRRLQQRM